MSKNFTIIPKLAHKHSIQYVAPVAPKGDEEGHTEYWTCEGCGKYYSDEDGNKQISLESTVLKSIFDIVDFVVEVEEGKDPVVLQLTDTQIIDAGQARPRRGGVLEEFWATDQVEERCYDYVRETIEATKPDFIILTGDIVYGEFDDSGAALLSFIKFMDSFGILWSPVFRNHDNESTKGADWQCEQFENSENCLFEQKTLTGNGNYSVGIAQGKELKRVFYMLDSNGCGAMSTETYNNGHSTSTVGFGQDQIAWYTNQITELKENSPQTKISFAYHIQQAVFGDALVKYGFDQSVKLQGDGLGIDIDKLSNKEESDFGFVGRQMKDAWDTNYSIWNGMKELGVDSVFVGHEHCNSSSVVYQGVRLQYGQKSSEYDRFNCLNAEGTITGNYNKTGKSMIGGTVIPISEEDGVISTPYIYLCDWDEVTEKIQVNGLQCGGVNDTTAELWADGAVTAEAVNFDERTTAYKVVAEEQGKLYVNTNLLKEKTKFTFSVYLTENSTAKLGGYGEFAIRVKPNDSEPLLDGNVNGYIDFNSGASDSSLKLEFGKWQTFTVDITGLDATCTEFAFNIAKDNIIYLKDISFS